MGKVIAAKPGTTSPFELRETLKRSLAARRRVETFGEFIDACLAHGVRLTTPIEAIEFGTAQTIDTRRVEVEFDEDGNKVTISEAQR